MQTHNHKDSPTNEREKRYRHKNIQCVQISEASKRLTQRSNNRERERRTQNTMSQKNMRTVGHREGHRQHSPTQSPN